MSGIESRLRRLRIQPAMSREQRAKSEIKQRQDSLVESFKFNPLLMSQESAARLLHELCVELGYCLDPEKRQLLIEKPPGDPDTFSRTVMELEGVESEDPIRYGCAQK